MKVTTELSGEQIREAVRERYAEAAKRAQALQQASCGCGCSCEGIDEGSRSYYQTSELNEIPTGAALASLGCGNPTLLAQLRPGETVLDLGSGGGIDVLLSARRVGPSGKAYGLDMTDEMLALARRNAQEAGVANVEFLKGQIEAIPLPDSSVDVIISNCVINLSADKDAVLREAFRVLKPGGRFAVADIVVQGNPMPPELRQFMALWAGCLSGALTEDEYRGKLAAAGFEGVEVQVLRTHGLEDVPEAYRDLVPQDLIERAGTRVTSAFVRATKTAARAGQGTRPSPSASSVSSPALPIVNQACCCGDAPATASPTSCCCGEAPTTADREARR
jgi:SAM-dependent methyltransferase